MGGPASPFIWNLSYDPIVHALFITTGAEPPTYVDDLAAKVVGPRQALEVQIFIASAGKVAGLHTDTHTCTWIEGHGDIWNLRQ
eukprot:10152590-Heterocapsa_arctica.AAC.1